MTRATEAPIGALRLILSRFDYPVERREVVESVGDERLVVQDQVVAMSDVMSVISKGTFTSLDQAVELAAEAWDHVTPRGAE